MKIIHIGYGDSATECITEAIKDHSLPGDTVIPSRDTFDVGPISECGAKMDGNQRINFWKMIDSELDLDMTVDAFYKESMAILNEVDNAEVVLWQGDSCHDILATAWLISYFDNRNIKWTIIDLARLSPEQLNNGLPAVNVAMFLPSQVAGLYRYKQAVGPDARQMYLDLWIAMRKENAMFRIKDGYDIVSVAEDYHDDFILSNVPSEWTPAAEVVGSIMGISKHTITDTIVEWRIRKMINNSQVEYQGALKNLKSYEIKSKKSD